jgi:hypothetical protein
MPDGYWYNGMLLAEINRMDERGGLTPIVTTNPLMRANYTSLEKMVDSLHGQKQSWWDKHGSWILGISFVLIAGVMLWLNYREFVKVSSSLSSTVNEVSNLIKQLSNLASNIQSTGSNGLIQT